MKESRWIAVAVLAALLTAVAIFLPDLAAEVRDRTAAALALDRDYLAVFEDLGRRLSKSETPKPTPLIPFPTPTAAPTEPPRTQTQELVYRVEESATAGEQYDAPEPEPKPEPEPVEELPAAVAAFLEAQAPFLADNELPEKVDYTYAELPFEYVLPVAGYNSSGFGFRMHPILNEVKFHYGTDIAAWTGEEIRAFADGTVTFSGLSDSYGNYITVDHGDGWTTLYAHCSKLYVMGGQTVKAGQKIALVGATGRVTGPHLHFELMQAGVYHNPEYYING